MDVMIVPKECKKLTRVTLPSPNDNKPQHYLCDEENLALYEIVKFSDSYRAWFIDNYLCKEGHFNMVTKVDPLFLFVPVMMKYAKTQYRPLHDVCQDFASAGGTSNQGGDGNNRQEDGFSSLECALTPYIHWQSICDTRDIDGDLFVRFSETKTMEWLLKKHDRLMVTLKDEMSEQSSKATLMSHASDLLSEYIPESLCAAFKQAVRDRHTMGAARK